MYKSNRITTTSFVESIVRPGCWLGKRQCEKVRHRYLYKVWNDGSNRDNKALRHKQLQVRRRSWSTHRASMTWNHNRFQGWMHTKLHELRHACFMSAYTLLSWLSNSWWCHDISFNDIGYRSEPRMSNVYGSSRVIKSQDASFKRHLQSLNVSKDIYNFRLNSHDTEQNMGKTQALSSCPIVQDKHQSLRQDEQQRCRKSMFTATPSGWFRSIDRTAKRDRNQVSEVTRRSARKGRAYRLKAS